MPLNIVRSYSWYVTQDRLNKLRVPSKKIRVGLPTKRRGQKSGATDVDEASLSAAEALLEQSTKM